MDQAGNASTGQGASDAATDDSATGSTDRNSKFLASVAASPDRSTVARKIDRIDAVIPEGTMIAGILETAINSDLPDKSAPSLATNIIRLMDGVS